MSSETYTLDPEGDLIIVLPASRASTPEPEVYAVDNKHDDSFTKAATAAADVAKRGETKSRVYKRIRVKASSKHLTLASTYFKTLLRGPFQEDHSPRETGVLSMFLLDDDADAFLVVLNIVHGRFNMIPRSLDVRMLAEIAIIVDKYNLEIAVAPFAEKWIEKSLPLLTNGTLDYYVLWSWVAWVFQRPVLFAHATKQIIWDSDDSCNSGNYPQLRIPHAIETTRRKALREVEVSLYVALGTYQSKETQYTTRLKRELCDAVALGTITKAMASILQRTPPYCGLSLGDILAQLLRAPLRSLCEIEMPECTYNGNAAVPACSLERRIRRLFDDCDHQLQGLELGQFKNRGEGAKSSN